MLSLPCSITRRSCVILKPGPLIQATARVIFLRQQVCGRAGSGVADLSEYRRRFLRSVGPVVGESLFDTIPDMVFFVKDTGGRYVSVNRTLVERCGLSDKGELIGRTAAEVFPRELGDAFLLQDRKVLSGGPGIRDHLELHLSISRRATWCLTNKEAVRTASGEIVGICGISRDLHAPASQGKEYRALAKVLDFIHTNFGEPLRLPKLAEMSGLSLYQFDQRIRQLFQLSAGQYLVKTRIDAACQRLAKSNESIAAIGIDCGYSDQPAFSRQFKQVVGLSPKVYREKAKVQISESGIRDRHGI
ncbi:MAG: AraC family transcriptional regulator [Verrucomicrobiaceae bacterium]|nr:MAG: AraC family transcriptional regulator [Verrucomicrobiaceae bacterium]